MKRKNAPEECNKIVKKPVSIEKELASKVF
jgi:hypothetical protein